MTKDYDDGYDPRYDYDYEGCYCSACRMPPCSWCENGGGADEQEEHDCTCSMQVLMSLGCQCGGK